MHAKSGITTPAIATMSDGTIATTKTIIEIPQISDPVMEDQNYPPRPNSGTNRDSHRGAECACYPATKIAPNRKQCGRTESRNKDKYSNRPTKGNRESTLVADHVELVLACSGGPFGTITTVTSISISSSHTVRCSLVNTFSYNLSVS
jgi:hypothetical protein